MCFQNIYLCVKFSFLFYFRSSFVCTLYISCGPMYDNISFSLWHSIPKRNSYGCIQVTGCTGQSHGSSCGLCSLLDDRPWDLLFCWRIGSNYSLFDAEILQDLLKTCWRPIVAYIVYWLTSPEICYKIRSDYSLFYAEILRNLLKTFFTRSICYKHF